MMNLKKHWKIWVAGILLSSLCCFVAFCAMWLLLFNSMFGSSEDGFASNLVIPENIEIAEPIHASDIESTQENDDFQSTLLSALETPGSNDPKITADIPSLAYLHTNAPKILQRYLASSPAWRVFEEDGKVFATRRWMIGSQWRYTLHGYYTAHSVHSWPSAEGMAFQSRFTIGFSGEPWARISDETTLINVGETTPLKLSMGNQLYESRCIITTDNLVVEIFEQSDAQERRLTKAALSYLEQELSPLAEQPTWSTMRKNLPPESISHGSPSFELWASFQPGIYDSNIWVNPGEPGMLYLKAFEVTKATPLSTNRLKEYSNEWIGWSDDPQELFFSNTHFTIYEGDWGQPYAARFEVWFSPDAGGADRKLMEKVFKIEGWQR